VDAAKGAAWSPLDSPRDGARLRRRNNESRRQHAGDTWAVAPPPFAEQFFSRLVEYHRASRSLTCTCNLVRASRPRQAPPPHTDSQAGRWRQHATTRHLRSATWGPPWSPSRAATCANTSR